MDDDTLASLRSALDATPENPDLRMVLVNTYLERGEPSDAYALVRDLDAAATANDDHRRLAATCSTCTSGNPSASSTPSSRTPGRKCRRPRLPAEAAGALAAAGFLDPGPAMSDQEVDRWMALAEQQLERKQTHAAIDLLRRALTIEPDHPEAHALLALCLLSQRRTHAAEHEANLALALDAGSSACLYAAGQVHIARRRFRQAEECFRELLAAIKARSSWLLGLWWRYSAWMGALGEGRILVVLLAAYLVYRVAYITAQGYKMAGLASYIELLWLAIVAYTWIGPGIFQRSLEKELATIKLDRGF